MTQIREEVFLTKIKFNLANLGVLMVVLFKNNKTWLIMSGIIFVKLCFADMDKNIWKHSQEMMIWLLVVSKLI